MRGTRARARGGRALTLDEVDEPAPRILVATAMELTRDPRARRQVAAARAQGLEVVGLSGTAGEDPVPLEGVTITRVVTGRAGTFRTAVGGFRRSSAPIRELRGLARILRLARTTRRLVAGGRGLGEFEIVHANDFATLPAAWLLTRRTSTRLVYDAHEVYASEEVNGPWLYARFVTIVEGFLARRADAVVTVSEPIADELVRTLRLPRRPIIVLNAPDRDERPLERVAAGPLRAVYQGAIGPNWELDDLLVVAEHAEGVSFTIRVAGADREALEREVAARGLAATVKIVPPVAPDRLVDALRPFEIGLLVHRAGARSSDLVFPNKIFEYMLAGLAVGSSALKGLTPLVSEEEIGVLFEPGDPGELGAILSELGRDRPRVTAMRERAHRLALERFHAEAQVPRLVEAWGLSTTRAEHAAT